MLLLVSDTSVLIDLERGELLTQAFSCGLRMVVPDLLYTRELAADKGPLLRRLGLGIVTLRPEEVAVAQQLRSLRPALSLPDCFALSCARRQGHALLSGDKVLRSEAEARQCEVHGLLWLLDRMEDSGRVEPIALRDGLARIWRHPRCRLPKAEVLGRLAQWHQKEADIRPSFT